MEMVSALVHRDIAVTVVDDLGHALGQVLEDVVNVVAGNQQIGDVQLVHIKAGGVVCEPCQQEDQQAEWQEWATRAKAGPTQANLGRCGRWAGHAELRLMARGDCKPIARLSVGKIVVRHVRTPALIVF